jgi:hypothetical protein
MHPARIKRHVQFSSPKAAANESKYPNDWSGQRPARGHAYHLNQKTNTTSLVTRAEVSSTAASVAGKTPPHNIGSPRKTRSNKSGSIVVKISEEQFHFCELEQASRRLPPTSAQVLGERREQTL